MLRAQVDELGLQNRVHFLGALPPDRVRMALAAADLSVLASSNEGWGERAARVDGLRRARGRDRRRRQCRSRLGADLGAVVPLGDQAALCRALHDALQKDWDRQRIRKYAEQNDWSARVPLLVEEFARIAAAADAGAAPVAGGGATVG